MKPFRQYINEGWAQLSKMKPYDEILSSMANNKPKKKALVGKNWNSRLKELESTNKYAVHAAMAAIHRLIWEGIALPKSKKSGYGVPEGKATYKFSKNDNCYHVHLTKGAKYSLCWKYNGSTLVFDLVHHTEYDKYCESDHEANTKPFIIPKRT